MNTEIAESISQAIGRVILQTGRIANPFKDIFRHVLGRLKGTKSLIFDIIFAI